MPRTIQAKARRGAATSKTIATPIPAPVTSIDKIVLEIRRFIAGAIFFNSKAAEKVGLGLTDMQMINLLQLNGPSTPSRLGEWTGLSSGGVTVALDRLEKAGYVRREPNPSDRRSSLIVLMPVHMKKLKGMYEEVEEETRRLLGAMPESDLVAVVRFFEAFTAARGDGRATDGN
jgi:MarR family transcriptional regulator, organic hydroperoxide resistance regulator